MILYCDGGSHGANSRQNTHGVYCSVYDESLAQVVVDKTFPIYRTNNEAEFCGIIEALHYAHHNMREGEDSVTICGDSQLAIYGMTGKYKIRQAHLLPLLGEAHDYVVALRNTGITVTFEWVPRNEIVYRVGH